MENVACVGLKFKADAAITMFLSLITPNNSSVCLVEKVYAVFINDYGMKKLFFHLNCAFRRRFASLEFAYLELFF